MAMLKSNMGDEMAEMMSQEITRVMDQQRHLEKEYAQLVTMRSELKGLSNKHKLQDIRSEILVTFSPLSRVNPCVCVIASSERAEGFDAYLVPLAAGQPGRGGQQEEDRG